MPLTSLEDPKAAAIPEIIRMMMILVFIDNENLIYYPFGSVGLPPAPPSFGLTSCSVQAVMLMALTIKRMMM